MSKSLFQVIIWCYSLILIALLFSSLPFYPVEMFFDWLARPIEKIGFGDSKLLLIVLMLLALPLFFLLRASKTARMVTVEGQVKPAKRGAVIWLTGLSGAGKSTIAKHLLAELASKGYATQWLDGDVTREYIPCLGFGQKERNFNVLYTGFIAQLLEQHGIVTVASYISPYEETRNQVRDYCRNFIEVHVSTPLQTCESRDVKGLYAKARGGEIKQFTGIDAPYEPPTRPELRIDTSTTPPDEATQLILACFLQKQNSSLPQSNPSSVPGG